MSACNKTSPVLYMYVRTWPVHLCHFPIPMSLVTSACNKASPTDMLYMYVRGLSTSVTALSPCPWSHLLVTRPLPCYTCTHVRGLSTSVTSLSPCPPSCLLVTSLSHGHAIHVRTTMACPPLSSPIPMSSVMSACNKPLPCYTCMYVRTWLVHLCHLPIPMSSVMSACNN